MKEHGILSGDAFYHLVLQLAQYETFNKTKNTYIAVDMCKKFKGRTECIRPASTYTQKIIEEIIINKNTNPQKLKPLFRDAFNEHFKRLKDCQRGHGVNRHLFGLHMSFLENKEKLKLSDHNFFESLAYKKISNNRLSTTSIAYPFIPIGMFKPVEENGVGVFYVINNKKLWFSLMSFKKDRKTAEKLLNNFDKYLNLLIEIVKGQ